MAHAAVGGSEVVCQPLLDRTRNVGAQGRGPGVSPPTCVGSTVSQSTDPTAWLFLRPAGLHMGCTLAASPGVRCQVHIHDIIWQTDWQGVGSLVESLQV